MSKNLYWNKESQSLECSYEDILAIEAEKLTYDFIQTVEDNFCPSSYEYIDGNIQEKVKYVNNIKPLSDTDWLILRHRDQLELGVDTSLTENEYLELLKQRQEWRNTHNNIK